MDITMYQVQGHVPVTVLQPHGDLDARSFKDLIAKAQEVYDAGARDVVLDLGDVPYMSSSGLVALNTMARLLRSQAAADLEGGWDALHDIERNVQQGLHPHLKVVNPQPAVENVLRMVGMNQMFEVFADVPGAVASF